MKNNKNGFRFRYKIEKTNNKGLGVFASEAIKQGSTVWSHVPGLYQVYDEQLFRSTIQKLSHAEVVYELTHIFGLKEFPDCLIRILDDGVLINHSANANLVTNRAVATDEILEKSSPDYLRKVAGSLLDFRYSLVAIRDIWEGEEFTNDYAAEIHDPPYYATLCEQYFVRENYLDEDDN